MRTREQGGRAIAHWGWLVLLAALAGTLACTSTEAEVLIEGELSVGACEDLLPFRPSFATYTTTPEGDGLFRFQSGDGALSGDDHVVLLVQDAAAVEGRVGEPLSLALPGETGDASGSIQFWQRCPEERGVATALRGTVVFDRFENRTEARMTGRMTFDVVDARDPAVIYGEDLTGSFDFVVLRFPPFQTFGGRSGAGRRTTLD